MKRIFPLLLCFLMVIGVWELTSQSDPRYGLLFPPPSRILTRLYQSAPRFWMHSLTTIQEILGGFALALCVAFPLAYLMVRSISMRFFLQPVLVMMQAVPMFALAPLMIIWFDWSYTAVVIPTALMIFFPLVIAVYCGLDAAPRDLLDYFYMHQATEWQTLIKLRLRFAMPQIFSGLRVSAAVAGLGAIAGEWAGAQQGLGVLMMESRRSADFDTAFAALVCLTLLTLGLYGGVVCLGRWMLRRKTWTMSIVLLMCMSGCSEPSSTDRPLRLMLDWLPNPNHVPIYVGIRKGFFAQEGVDLTVIKLQDPADLFPYLTSGQADLGVSYMTYLIQARTQGVDAKAVGYLIKEPMNSFLFRKELNMHSVSDLDGKVLAASPDDFLNRTLDNLFAAKQIRPSARQSVGFDLTAALLTGKVDVLYNAFWNIEGEQLRSLGVDIDHFLLTDLGMPRYFELLLAAPGSLLQRHPAFAKKMKSALSRAIDFCLKHPDEAFLIYQEANLDKSPKTLTWEKKAWALTLPLLAKDQDDEPNVWQQFLDWLSARNLLPSQVTVSHLVPDA